MSEYGFVFDENRCTGCYACTVACKSWRNVEIGKVEGDVFTTIRYRRIEKRWKGEYPQTSFRTFSVSCQHCVKPWCIPECPVEAIRKNADGIVVVDYDKCIGCQTCLSVCPFKAPQFSVHEDGGQMQKCDMCIGQIDHDYEDPPCVATCNTKALSIKKLSVTEKEANQNKLMQLFS